MSKFKFLKREFHIYIYIYIYIYTLRLGYNIILFQIKKNSYLKKIREKKFSKLAKENQTLLTVFNDRSFCPEKGLK